MSLPDTFTGSNGTALNTYDATWVSHASYSGVIEIQSNHAKQRSSANNSLFYYNSAPSSADYDVTATIQISSSGSSNQGGVAGRIATGANTAYYCRPNSTNLELFKIVAGSATQLGTVANGMSNNTDYTLKLSMAGTAIKVFLDSTQMISVTDSAISAAGFAGMRILNTNTSVYLDNFNFTGASAEVLFRRTENARIGSRC